MQWMLLFAPCEPEPEIEPWEPSIDELYVDGAGDA
jgi:hypothetical protein